MEQTSAGESARPLLSFIVVAYNQERFIREAIEGAFAQTYSPLEIILSDDCSEDMTFEIMQDMMADYDGPHQIVLNRNVCNLGIVGHVNRVIALAKGALMVMAAGDDISFSERTEKLFELWDSEGRPMAVLHSAAFLFVENNGTFTKESIISLNPGNDLFDIITRWKWPLGASEAWSASLVRFFGPLRSDVDHEDVPFLYRGVLAQHVLFHPDPLLCWRQGYGIISGLDNRRLKSLRGIHERLAKERRRFRGFSWQLRDDLKKLENSGGSQIFRLVEYYSARSEYAWACMNAGIVMWGRCGCVYFLRSVRISCFSFRDLIRWPCRGVFLRLLRILDMLGGNGEIDKPMTR